MGAIHSNAFPQEELTIPYLKDRIQVMESELNAARSTASDLAAALGETKIQLAACQTALCEQKRVAHAFRELVVELFERATK